MTITDVTIEALGPKGDGIARGPRGRVYVERTAPGDVVRVGLTRDSEGLMRGEVQSVLQPSPARQKPPCPHYDACGGCTVQHLKPQAYQNFKQGIVHEAFEKNEIRVKKWLPPVFIGPETRRRATFAAVKQGKRLTLGYFKRRSQQVYAVDTCLVADSRLMAVRVALATFLTEIVRDGQALDVFVQVVGTAVDVVFTGPLGPKGKPDSALNSLLAPWADRAGIARVGWRARVRDRIEPLVNLRPVTARFGQLDVVLPAAAFLQPTVAGETALVAAVMSALPAKGRFADLFSGCGTFSGPMLERGAVDAYESEPAAIQALGRAGGGRALKAVRRDLFTDPLRRDEANRYDAIVFDPPRAGAEAQSRLLASSKVRTLVAVSCNPATFARDARLLIAGGYRCDSVQVVDQFVWSHHVELVACFTRAKRS